MTATCRRPSRKVLVPGPDDSSHRTAILDAAGGRITHIFVTHAHLDHSAGAAALAHATGAPVLAFGDALTGRSATMQRLATAGLSGGEGLDLGFSPDRILADQEVVETPDWSIRAIHTPGHAANHLSFAFEDMLFCGDIVLGWSSTLISPPDGDLIDYFRSLERIAALNPARLLPAHGAPVDSPAARLQELARHRRERSAQILRQLRQGPANAPALAAQIYEVPPSLMPAATRNVLAHLLALSALGAVRPEGELAAATRFSLG